MAHWCRRHQHECAYMDILTLVQFFIYRWRLNRPNLTKISQNTGHWYKNSSAKFYLAAFDRLEDIQEKLKWGRSHRKSRPRQGRDSDLQRQVPIFMLHVSLWVILGQRYWCPPLYIRVTSCQIMSGQSVFLFLIRINSASSVDLRWPRKGQMQVTHKFIAALKSATLAATTATAV